MLSLTSAQWQQRLLTEYDDVAVFDCILKVNLIGATFYLHGARLMHRCFIAIIRPGARTRAWRVLGELALFMSMLIIPRGDRQKGECKAC